MTKLVCNDGKLKSRDMLPRTTKQFQFTSYCCAAQTVSTISQEGFNCNTHDYTDDRTTKKFQNKVTLRLAVQRRFSNSPALPMRASGTSFQSVPPIETQLCCCLKLGPLPIPHSGEMHSPIHGKSLGSL